MVDLLGLTQWIMTPFGVRSGVTVVCLSDPHWILTFFDHWRACLIHVRFGPGVAIFWGSRRIFLEEAVSSLKIGKSGEFVSSVPFMNTGDI